MELMNRFFGRKHNRDVDIDMDMRGPEEEKRGINRHNRGVKSPKDSSEDINNFSEEDNLT
jgi:hypothetical protein